LSGGEIRCKSTGEIVEYEMSPQYWVDTFLAVFGIVTFITGMFTYLVHGHQRSNVSASKYWPSVVGTVVSSAVEQRDPKKKKTYSAAVRYSYSVGGKVYQSDRVFWATNEGPEEKMAAIVAAYPAGKDVWVQHDRKDPAKAVLEPDKNTGLSKVVIFYAAGMMLLGIAALWGGLYALSH
jgi:hypothetical protein